MGVFKRLYPDVPITNVVTSITVLRLLKIFRSSFDSIFDVVSVRYLIRRRQFFAPLRYTQLYLIRDSV